MHSVRIFRHYMRAPLLLLACIEGVMFAAAFYAGFHLRYWSVGLEATADTSYLFAYSLFVAGVFILTMGAMGLYESNLREGLNGSLIRISVSLLLGSIFLAAFSFFVPHLELWRSILAITVVLSFMGVLSLRLGFVMVNPGGFKRRVLIFGDAPIVDEMMGVNQKGLDVIRLIPKNCERLSTDAPAIDYDKPLLQIASETQSDDLVIAFKDRRGNLPIEELLDCRMSGIHVLEPLGFFERELGLVKLGLLTPSWLFHSDGFRYGAMKMLFKRLMDIGLSLLFLGLFWPVMLLTAAAIYVESGFRHSVFYLQTRVGEGGVPFRVIKFRSMRVDAEADGKPRWATQDDDRITRVGHFIRKTRIDELPQIFNILRGEMSFVGPRPERPEFVADFARNHDYYAARLHVKPGLTGWAQLCYPYGNTEEDALRKLEYDLYYIKNHSTFLDLLILVETVEVVLFGRGAL